MPRDDGADGGHPSPPPGASTEGELGQFPVTETHEGGVAHDLADGTRLFIPGQVLGDRYQIHSQLGRGGMGEVWRAFDLKLRVDVALKALRGDLVSDEKRRESLRREVRAAREVISPNVCRIFDLIEADGRELVSMEYVDGGTLLEVLQERGPLDLQEAQDIASQFLAGLEAIHKVGLVHRDVKPENIMLTRAGRVVLMDFGLARQEDSGTVRVAGTPAYMAPEQAVGLKVDARTDVYSAGVVLAEMVTPEGIKDLESRQSVWDGIRQEPARVPKSPWAPVLKKAVANEPDNRYNSAHTLTRALEDVTLRVEGAEDLTPYPGLTSFTEEDAEYFFGREAEVEQMWSRFERTHFLAIVGPSGAGKSSFIGAGLAPNAPSGWAIVRCTPGNAATTSLRKVLVSEIGGGSDAMKELADVDNPNAMVSSISRWRRRHEQALLIVDQFEELFTQNTSDEQLRFADMLGRLPVESDVHVLLSMRDDFLMRCNKHEALKPIFSELTPLDPPVGPALRRALVQPATKCGYRFEDNELVEEILAEVEGERGALPLVAFAMARLWEKRDRDNGLLTRRAYHDIGGVGGALARHAEATIDHVGADRIALVRELFRNLVTAEGTRAVREWNELLSVFEEGQQQTAEKILNELIDARLLTSYEIQEEGKEPNRRVEIIHESLLANWPRLVRWQTQNEEGAQLRDELRQAARSWDEHGRQNDRLWTGTAFREFQLWSERYPGGLTDTEDAFGSATTVLAGRRRRRRRVVVAAGFAILFAGLAVVGSFWQRSVRETLRAEAAKLLALAQVQLDTDPTEALAYATTSLELADTNESRIFAMRAMWAGPTLRALDVDDTGPSGQFALPVFSPDGRWLALGAFKNEFVLVWNESGGSPIVLGGHGVSANNPNWCAWTRENLLVTGHQIEGRVRIWAMPEGQLVREIELGGNGFWQVGDSDLFVGVEESEASSGRTVYRLRSWRLPDGEPEELGKVGTPGVFDPSGRSWVFAKGDSIFSRPLPIRAGMPGTLIARHSGEASVGSWPRPGGLYSSDSKGEIILWTTADGISIPGRRLRPPESATTRLTPEASGRWAVDWRANAGQREGKMLMWDLQGMAAARPIELRRSGGWSYSHIGFHPRGDWVAASTHNLSELSFWPLRKAFATVVEGYDTFWQLTVGFTRDGRFLVTNWGQDRVRLWPLPGAENLDVVDLMLPQTVGTRCEFAVDPTGQRILSAGYWNGIFLLSLDGEEPLQLGGFPKGDLVLGGAFSPNGNLVAAASLFSENRPMLRVWNLESGNVKTFDLPQMGKNPDVEDSSQDYVVSQLLFADDTTLYTSGGNGLLRWNLETGSYEEIIKTEPGAHLHMRASADRQMILTYESADLYSLGRVNLHDLATGYVRRVEIPGESTRGSVGLGPEGMTWVAGDDDGLIWVGRTDSGEAHVLAGHGGPVRSVAISPDRKWIASSGEDKTLRLWPMPDLSKPPLHTLPLEELIAKLKTLTNLRVVRDEESATGWKLEVGPFPGWKTVPTW